MQAEKSTFAFRHRTDTFCRCCEAAHHLLLLLVGSDFLKKIELFEEDSRPSGKWQRLCRMSRRPVARAMPEKSPAWTICRVSLEGRPTNTR